MRTQITINLHNVEEIDMFKCAMEWAANECAKESDAEDCTTSGRTRLLIAKAQFNEIADTIRKHTSSGDNPIPSTLKFQ